MMSSIIQLPAPKTDGAISLERAIQMRRSCRSYIDGTMTQAQLAQLVWSAQGITDPKDGFRASPSAGAIFPVTLWVYALDVEGLPRYSLWIYEPKEHALREKVSPEGDPTLATICFGQEWIDSVAVTFLLTCTTAAMMKKYGEGSERYIDLEAGHIVQNVHLQAVTLGLNGCAVAAYADADIQKFLKTRQKPLYIMPVGFPAE
jgi:SagB-type dehydrogenase family enzyme